MNAVITKSKAVGNISAPPSKSMAHRYIICAALSKGQSVISNVDLSQDILATLDCIKAMGANVEISGDTVVINACDKIKSESIDFMCRESGSTMRFFMGIAMCLGVPSYFYGSETLRNRPFGIYEKICVDQGIEFIRQEDKIYVNGQLCAGEYNIAGNVSSQFITGLMFVLPMLDTDSRIRLIPPVESRSYIDLTIQALGDFGVSVVWEDEYTLFIRGNQQYEGRSISVEGDCSNAAFLEAFNYCGGSVTVTGLKPDTIQGDRVYSECFDKLSKGHATIDISDCPDLGPVLFAVAALNHGGSFTGTKRLKIKESDRGSVMCRELSKFSIETKMSENDIEIYKGTIKPSTEELDGHNDHRIVMSLAIILSTVGGTITGAEAVRKSYPGFFDDIRTLGIEVLTDGMD